MATTRTAPIPAALRRFSALDVERAMLAVATVLAAELPAGPDAGSVVLAARQPVTLAAGFADLCSWLGVPVPSFIRLALD